MDKTSRLLLLLKTPLCIKVCDWSYILHMVIYQRESKKNGRTYILRMTNLLVGKVHTNSHNISQSDEA